MHKKSRILIFGSSGLTGAGITRYLKNKGFSNIITDHLSGEKLTNAKSIFLLFRKNRPEYCFLASPREGGIVANIAYPAELIYDNLSIQTNVIHSAYSFGVKKLIFIASSCVYPKNSPQPLKEEYLLTGPLEPTNEPYAIAKIAGIKMCQAYNRQYGTNFISLIPANIFGPGDNFDLKTSHVICALIRRFHEAKAKREKAVTIWGSGKPSREFIYVRDLAEAAAFIMYNNSVFDVINVGSGTDISIRQLSCLIKKVVGFEGKIVFDIRKPDGVKRKLLDTSNFNALGWKPKISLQAAIEDTYRWYKQACKK